MVITDLVLGAFCVKERRNRCRRDKVKDGQKDRMTVCVSERIRKRCVSVWNKSEGRDYMVCNSLCSPASNTCVR